MKETIVGSVRPRSPGSPASPRPSKLQKISETPSENVKATAAPTVSRDPEAVVGAVRPRSPGSPESARPSKLQKISETPSENVKATAAPTVSRDPVVIRDFDINKVAISSFTCSSGELLWGHLNTLIEGSKSDRVDTTSGPHETMGGGTIIQHNFRYRAKARKGVWKVEPVLIGDWHVGYVCYHEDVSGIDVLRQAAKVGISGANNHENRDIVYVNRYDWGHWHDPGLQLVLDTLGLQKTEDDIRNTAHEGDSEADYYWGLISRRFMLVDPEGLSAIIQAMKDGEKLKRKNYLFYYPPAAAEAIETAEHGKKNQKLDSAVKVVATATSNAAPEAASTGETGASKGSSGEEVENGTGSSKRAANEPEAVRSALASGNSSVPFGVNLVTKAPEYELGWMKFEKGELVGFVYDGEYSALEIYPEGSELKVGGTVAKLENDDSEEEEEDPPYAPSSDTESTDSEPDVRYYVGSETESEAGSQATSRDTQGGDEEQGEECVSKEISSSARVLEVIHEEEDGAEDGAEDGGEDGAEPSKLSAANVPPVIVDEKLVTPDLPGPSS
ncbi:hypothetical protein R1sor_017125 [Riccia sorocarpa]|uniref:Uncharacterized protein n=1 Tax=Riccia sorocarpa TaxID=122646 RepID=A0ABD3I5X0_9MARC